MYSMTSKHTLPNFCCVFDKCQEFSISQNMEKCMFLVYLGVILGYVVSKVGKLPNPKKILVIENMPMPKRLKTYKFSMNGPVLLMFHQELCLHQEALTMVYVLQFKHYLLGNKFVFYVDHMALLYFVKKFQLLGQITSQLLLLLEYDFLVVYKPRHSHLVVDVFL